MAITENFAVVGPWRRGACPRCGGPQRHVARKEGHFLYALHCSGCDLFQLGRSPVEAEEGFMKAGRGQHTLGKHPGIFWDTHAASKVQADGRAMQMASGLLLRATEVIGGSGFVLLDLNYGPEDGTSCALIQDPRLRAAAFSLLEDGVGRVMGEILKWKMPV